MNGNYGLTYPSEKDYYDVNVTNENFSKLADGIDAVKSGGLRKEVVVAAYNSKNPYKVVADFVCTKDNCSTVIANAINNCCDGGVVLLLDGDYYLKSTVNINKVVSLWGYGNKTRIIQADNFTGYALFNLAANNISLKQLKLEDSITSVRGIHLITITSQIAGIGGCEFYMNRGGEDNTVAPVYTEAYSCRLLMVGNYIRKHDDGKYCVNADSTNLCGVVVGNYCENMDSDSELAIGINVKNTGSVSKVKHGAQNTKFYVNGGEYNG